MAELLSEEDFEAVVEWAEIEAIATRTRDSDRDNFDAVARALEAERAARLAAEAALNERAAVAAHVEAQLLARAEKAEADLRTMRERYEGWQPIATAPHPVHIERGSLLAFYDSRDEGCSWNGPWAKRGTADIWCHIYSPNLNDAAFALLGDRAD